PGADGVLDATLLAWRDAARAELSRFEPAASGRVVLADRYPEPELPWEPPAAARPLPNPYDAGSLFHGPSFQLLRSFAIGETGSTATLDAAAGGTPRGLLHEALLDGLTHGIPHDGLCAWSPEIPPDLVGYPHRATLRLFGELPRQGLIRLETRFAGFDGDTRFPKLEIQAIAEGRVVAHLALVEVLFPKGPIGTAEPRARRAFLRDRTFAEGVRLSTDDGVTTRLAAEAVRASDWLPGTIAAALGTDPADLPALAAKEHVAARARVHPASVRLADGGQAARCEA
ncbi:MAG TPA: 3-hydroxyacyl-[acyl-carrier-protein] dehydratase FabA, partial [Myxococcales bacterium]|nr:3-hydroxyacyl-[acyl-carrier-protein] dehydratase FabA [Myxococcales bacterium]